MKKTKQDLIDELKAQIAADPEGAKRPFVGAGSRSYSLEDMLAEIENDTEMGQRLVQSYLELTALQIQQS